MSEFLGITATAVCIPHDALMLRKISTSFFPRGTESSVVILVSFPLTARMGYKTKYMFVCIFLLSKTDPDPINL